MRVSIIFALTLMLVTGSLEGQAADEPGPDSAPGVIAEKSMPRVLPGGTWTSMTMMLPASERIKIDSVTYMPADGDSKADTVVNLEPTRYYLRQNEDNPTHWELVFYVPAPDHWSFWQDRVLDIKAIRLNQNNEAEGTLNLFGGPISISHQGFSLTLALFGVLAVYPGAAALNFGWKRWRLRNTRVALDETGSADVKVPSFWQTLDPVEMTKDELGRGSLAKLQIMFFSLLVFGLLLYALLRYGLLSDLSQDVLWLLGASAIGAVGGKFLHVTKDRLSLTNFAWLHRIGWLEQAEGPQRRALWRELVHDENGFDVFKLQLAVFSIVVAIGLLLGSTGDLSQFKIPTNIIALLGLSQGVYLVGKGVAQSPRIELDTRINELRELERKLLTSVQAAGIKPLTEEALSQIAPNEFSDYKTKFENTMEMFRSVYERKIPEDKNFRNRIEHQELS